MTPDLDAAMRLPPHNLDFERQLLSALMMDEGREALDFVGPLLRPEDFYRDAHQVLYRALLELHEAGRPADALSAADVLMRRPGAWDRFGGDDTLAEIAGAAPHAANACYHAQIVREKAKLRELIAASERSIAEAFAQAQPSDQILAAAAARIEAIDEGRGGGEAVTAADAVEELRSALEARRAGEVAGVPTGFRDLDTLLKGGLPEGGLVVVAGRPSMGKSALVLAICDRACVGLKTSALFVSLEMGRLELVERLVAIRAPLDGDRLKEAWHLRDDEWGRIGRASIEIGGAPLLIDDSPGATAQRIAALARRAARRGVGLVVVDYLQLVDGSGDGDRGASRQEVVAKVSRRMKTLARELGVPVVLLCQLNREAERREDHRPRMADLRESGAIEQDADIVLLLHRPEYYDRNDQPGIAEVIVAKHRNGATGLVKLEFVPQRAEFRDRGPDYIPADDWHEQFGGQS